MQLDLLDWQIAAIFAFLSASTFPIGAALGVLCATFKKTQNQEILSFFLSFGAGALIFAVTVELYAEGLRDIEENEEKKKRKIISFVCSIAAAIVGAVLFTFLEKQAHRLRHVIVEKILHKEKAAIQQKQNEENRTIAGENGDLGEEKNNFDLLEAHNVIVRRSSWFNLLLLKSEASNNKKINEKKEAEIMCENLDVGEEIKIEEEEKKLLLGDEKTNTEKNESEIQILCSTKQSSKMYDCYDSLDILSINGDKKTKNIKLSKIPNTVELLTVALVMWIGQLLDAFPEAMMIGFRTTGDNLSWAFVVSVLIANFPEAFSAGYIMKRENMRGTCVILLWLLVSVTTTLLAGLTAFLSPVKITSVSTLIFASVAQGLAGGAMLALVSASMLPAAFRIGGVLSGVFFVIGFLFSVSVRLFCGVLEGESLTLGQEAGLIQSKNKTENFTNHQQISYIQNYAYSNSSLFSF